MVIDRWRGVRRTLFNIIAANSLLFLTLTADELWVFLPLAVVTGVFYTSIMITTHDAIHHTLTGWYWVDEIVPRLYSYFIFWPHGLYSELHRLHHKYNGKDLADPENPTYTEAEYRAAGRFKQWRMRHRFALSLFAYGGVGLIIEHFREGFKLWRKSPLIRKLIVSDVVGILIATAITLAVLYAMGITWKYAVYLLIVERTLGFAMQLRLHIEHLGLWGEHEGLLETRLFNCRNISTNWFGEWFYNGLNYHSVHHAFPAIPYYQLREAHHRLDKVFADAGQEGLPVCKGYARTTFDLMKRPRLIPDSMYLQPSHSESSASSSLLASG